MKYIFILILISGCSNRLFGESKFHAGDQVTILSGFYKNCTASVQSGYSFINRWELINVNCKNLPYFTLHDFDGNNLK